MGYLDPAYRDFSPQVLAGGKATAHGFCSWLGPESGDEALPRLVASCLEAVSFFSVLHYVSLSLL